MAQAAEAVETAETAAAAGEAGLPGAFGLLCAVVRLGPVAVLPPSGDTGVDGGPVPTG